MKIVIPVGNEQVGTVAVQALQRDGARSSST